MWNTHRVGVTADNIVRYKASSLTVLRHSFAEVSTPQSVPSLHLNLLQNKRFQLSTITRDSLQTNM